MSIWAFEFWVKISFSSIFLQLLQVLFIFVFEICCQSENLCSTIGIDTDFNTFLQYLQIISCLPSSVQVATFEIIISVLLWAHRYFLYFL